MDVNRTEVRGSEELGGGEPSVRLSTKASIAASQGLSFDLRLADSALGLRSILPDLVS